MLGVARNRAFRALFARRLTEEVAVPQSGDRGRPTGEVQAGEVVEQAAKPVRLLARVGLVGLRAHPPRRGRPDRAGGVRRPRARGQEGRAPGDRRVGVGAAAAVGGRRGAGRARRPRLVDAVSAYRRKDGWRRVGRMAVAVGEAVVYAVLARSAATIAQAEGGDSFSKSVVAALFGLPGGPFLVGAVGVALVVEAAGRAGDAAGLGQELLDDLALPPRFRKPGPACSARWGGRRWGRRVSRRECCWSRPPLDSTPRRRSASTGRDPDVGRPAVRPGPAARAGRRPGGLRRLLPLFDARYRTE